MRILILSAALGLLAACASSRDPRAAEFAGLETLTFRIDGMACPNCAKHIEEDLARVPGVRAATVSFDTRSARVGLDRAHPATRESLEAAVATWKKEHFAADEDPECLDPTKRGQIKRGG